MFTNSTILNPLFWILIGVLNLGLLISLRYWFNDLKLKVSRLKWVIIIIYWVIVNIIIGGGFTLIGENETNAGLRFMGIFIIPVIIIGGFLFRWITNKKVT